jgi:hypothetical protein
MRERLEEYRERIKNIPVEMFVKDVAHAKSPEVINYAIIRLSAGDTWAELRAKLGLGSSASDPRWRVLRTLLVDGLMPATEEEALKAQISTRQFLLSKLEEQLDEVEMRIQIHGTDKLDKVTEHQFWKLRLETIKLLLEENNQAFESFIEMKKLKSLASKTGGSVINVINKFHIPRPGDNLKALKDVTDTMIEVIETKKIIDGELG